MSRTRSRKLASTALLLGVVVGASSAQTPTVVNTTPAPAFSASEVKALQAELIESWQEIESLRRELSQKSLKLQDIEAELQKARQAQDDRVLALLRQADEATAQVRSSRETITRLRETNRDLQTAQAELRAEIASIKAQKGDLDSAGAITEARERIQTLTADLNTEREALKITAKKYADLQGETDVLRRQLLALQQQTQTNSTATTAWREERESLVRAHTAALAESDRRLEEARAAGEDLRVRLNEAESALAAAGRERTEAVRLAVAETEKRIQVSSTSAGAREAAEAEGLRTRVAALEKAAQDAAALAGSLKAERDEQAAGRTAAAGEVENLKARVASAERDLEAVRQRETEAVRLAAAEADQRIQELTTKAAARDGELAEAQRQLESARRAQTELQERLKTSEAALAAAGPERGEAVRLAVAEAEKRLSDAQARTGDEAETRLRLQMAEAMAERLALAAEVDRLTFRLRQSARTGSEAEVLRKELARLRFAAELREASALDHAFMIQQIREALAKASRGKKPEVAHAEKR